MTSAYLGAPLRTLAQYRDVLAAALAALPSGDPRHTETAARLADVDAELAHLAGKTRRSPPPFAGMTRRTAPAR